MKLIPALLLTLLLFVGCSSKKPGSAADGSLEGANGTNQGLTLNGSSDDGNAGGLSTVFFPLDSLNLDGKAKQILKQNADLLKRNDKVMIQVEGHCDERGSRQYNLALGERRARTVRDYLTGLGIKANRISIISYGNERPIEEGSGEDSWSKNRRGNFVVTAL